MLEFSRNSVSIAGFAIHYYGIVIMLGVLFGVMLAMKREKLYDCPKDTALDLALVGVPAAIVFARIYYVIFEWPQFRGDIMSIFDIRSGGLAIYGGLIGAISAGYIYCRVKKLSFPAMADLAAPSIALGQAVGRWGNFFNQEAYGIEIVWEKLQFFPVGVYIEADKAWHFATFFYESVWCALIVIFIICAQKRGFFRRKGDVILWYLLLYGFERALVEGLRTDSLYLGPIRVSQALSIILIFAAAAVFFMRNRKDIIAGAGAALTGTAMVLSLFDLIYPALIMTVTGAAIVAFAYARAGKTQNI